MNVRYSRVGGGAAELSLLPTETLLFHGANPLSGADPVGVLVRADPNPFEWVGFVIFLAIGVAVTGYHDGDRPQRAVTAFAPGRWDAYRGQFTPMKT